MNQDNKIIYPNLVNYISEEIKKYKVGESSGDETTAPKKSIVDIRFESGTKLSYYNDKFDLHIGDIVYVDGKLEGQKGRVVDINYNFKIKLSDYKKIIAVVDTDVSGKFYTAGSHSVVFDSNAIPKEKIKLWFMAPQNEEDVVVSGNDDSFFYLDDIDIWELVKPFLTEEVFIS